MSMYMQRWLQHHGIKHKQNYTLHHFENGVDERLNPIVVQATICMRHAAKFGKQRKLGMHFEDIIGS